MQTVFGLILLTSIAFGVFYIIIDGMMFHLAIYEFYASTKGMKTRLLISFVAAAIFTLAAAVV